MIIGSNTKINIFINMINTEVLSEKIKYLIITEAGKEFNIISASLDIDEYSNNLIESYYVWVEFDYQGKIDPEVYNFAIDIQKMSNKMKDIVGKYTLTSNGKIVSGGENVTIGNGFIWGSKFTFEESHEFQMSFKITLLSEN
jgi:hypothetical protein